MSIDAMKQALEALELLARYENPATKIQIRKPRDGGSIVTMYPHKVASKAATALRAAIEQAQGLAEKIPAKGTLLEQTLGKVWDEMPHTALMDALVGGTGVMLGDKRIDPASIYKQPEQEPVAWVGPSWLNPETRTWESESFSPKPIKGWIPLYTAPRQWQGLTDDEREQFRRWAHPDMIEAIELRLQERNT